MKATLIDNTLRTTTHLEVVGVKDAVNQMKDRCRLVWDALPPALPPAAVINKLIVNRLEGPIWCVLCEAFYEGTEQTYFMMVRP